jgi:hypothetical protein
MQCFRLCFSRVFEGVCVHPSAVCMLTSDIGRLRRVAFTSRIYIDLLEEGNMCTQ